MGDNVNQIKTISELISNIHSTDENIGTTGTDTKLPPLRDHLLNISGINGSDRPVSTHDPVRRPPFWKRLDPINPRRKQGTVQIEPDLFPKFRNLTIVSPFHSNSPSRHDFDVDTYGTKKHRGNRCTEFIERIKSKFCKKNSETTKHQNGNGRSEFFVKSLNSYFHNKKFRTINLKTVSMSGSSNIPREIPQNKVRPDNVSIHSIAGGNPHSKTPGNENLVNEMDDHNKHLTSGSDHVLTDWMANLPSHCKEKPLNQLFIPGTHNSFTSQLEFGRLASDSQPWLKYLVRLSSSKAFQIIKRWSVTQSATIEEQLCHGIRQFDFRVAAVDGQLYTAHSLYGPTVEGLLIQIKCFLNLHKKEMVFIDFQHFYNFTDEDHNKLQLLVMDIFGSLLCPQMISIQGISINFLLQRKYQVLAFYRGSSKIPPPLWTGSWLHNPWPNTTKIEQMLDYVTDAIANRKPNVFLISQCILTPSNGYLLTHWTGNLKDNLASKCNEQIESWLQTPSVSSANIIMLDFADDNDWCLPRKIIDLNWQL